MQTFVSFLLCVAVGSAVQVFAPLPPGAYLEPKATGYIYRSDNDGPASLISLGVPQYQQPHAFAPPIPLRQPLVNLQPHFVNPINPVLPASLPYVAAEPAVYDEEVESDESDESDEEDDESNGLLDLGHAFEKGSGSDFNEEHQSGHGEKGSKGYGSKHHEQKGGSGHYGEEHDEGYHNEDGGEKESHHDEADSHGKHHESAEEYDAGDHGHKKHHSKGEDITGYHKVYHKDEFKKDHDFYDEADKSGHFNKHGYQKAHHGSEESAHKKAAKHDSGADQAGYGKSGHHAKGHHEDDDLGHDAEEGHESHYSQEGEFGKKGGASNEKEYEFEDGQDDY